MSDGFLTEEEVKSYLNVGPSELEDFIRRGKLTAYRVGGEFLRYRKDQVMALKGGRKFQFPDELERNWVDKIRDWWNFYSFYILASVLVILLIVLFMQY